MVKPAATGILMGFPPDGLPKLSGSLDELSVTQPLSLQHRTMTPSFGDGGSRPTGDELGRGMQCLLSEKALARSPQCPGLAVLRREQHAPLHS